MTVQQQAADLIYTLPDDAAEFIIEMIKRMTNPVDVNSNTATIIARSSEKKYDVSKRFGAGKGIIKNTDEFESDNDVIISLFEGVSQ